MGKPLPCGDFIEKTAAKAAVFSRLSKNCASATENRVAGELEGARPASNIIYYRRKVCKTELFCGFEA